MAVKIISETYTTPFKPASTTNWQLGNVGDWLKLSIEAQFAVEKRFDITDTLTINDPNELILNDGSSWGDWGFAVGMVCVLSFDVVTFDSSGNITGRFTNTIPFIVGNITGSTLSANDLSGVPKTTWGFQYGQIAPIRLSDKEINNVFVFSDQLMQGIQLDFTQVSNNNAPSGTLNSHIDGTKTSFVAEDTDLLAIGGVKDFDYYLTPYQSGLSVIRVAVKYNGATGHRKNYLIDVYYMLSPFGDSDDAQNNTAPDEVAGAEAITALYQLTGFPVYNNPNVQVKNDVKQTAKLGNTGWFDENFNQLPNNFTHTPVEYVNLSGDTVSALDYANPVVMTTTISGIPNLSGATRFQYGFIWDPLDNDVWEKTPYPFHENRKISTGGDAYNLNDWFALSAVVNSPFPALRSGYASDGATMDASDISFVQNGTDVDVSITFRPNAAFAAMFDALGEQDRNYRIWISAGDQAQPTNKSDRVSLLLDVNRLQTFVQPIGEWPGMTINFLDHSQVYTDTPVPCGNDIYAEDDLLAKVAFEIDTATGTDIPIPAKIKFGFLAQNATTGDQYVLDGNEVDLTQYPDPTQYNFDASRGFKLGAGNDKNWFKVDYDGVGTGTLEKVLGWYGYKIRWEDWIQRFPTPPTAFYDNTLLNNGLNNDWFHYFNTAGWNFYFYVDITATLDSQTVIYQNLKEVTILDYDVNTVITTELKYYRDNAGVKGTQLIGGTDPVYGGPLGVIPKGEIVWLDIEYTASVAQADWTSQVTVDANVYATSCSEVDNGAGQKQFRQLSSLFPPEFDNPMIGLPGVTLNTITWVSNTEIIVECRIDSNKLIDSDRYKISGRIGCIV